MKTPEVLEYFHQMVLRDRNDDEPKLVRFKYHIYIIVA